MKYFFDTSILVKLVHEEPGTKQVANIVLDMSNEIWLLDIAHLELLSALHRRHRNQELDEKELKSAIAEFKKKRPRFHTVSMNDSVLNEAHNLMEKYGGSNQLRTLDALHLAAALLLAEKDWKFVCGDLTLCKVAKAAGLQVINPNQSEPSPRKK